MKITQIKFKDIFKPRYAIIVEITNTPDIESYYGAYLVYKKTVGVIRLPIKRPLSIYFNDFYNGLTKQYSNSLVFCGSYRTFINIYGIGSTNKENMNNAIIFKL